MAFSFKHQTAVSPNPPDIDLTGQTILITGSNQGIGLESARQLLIYKASTVILAVRNVMKGDTARKLLLSEPAIKKLAIRPEIKIMEVDMADYKSVVKFSGEVKKQVQKLDALLLNAGIGQLNYELAPTGHEKVMQVNYLSNALLALELLPLLEATAEATGKPSRLSFVGSTQHQNSSFAKKRPYKSGSSILTRMDDKAVYSGMTVYGDTKLLVAMFVRELADRVSSDKVVINNMCPGGVNVRTSSFLFYTPVLKLLLIDSRYYSMQFNLLLSFAKQP